MEPCIRTQLERGVLEVVIDRPDRANALDEGAWHGLRDALAQAEQPAVRAVVVRGAGSVFCAGMDLKPDNPLLPRLAGAIQQRDRAALTALVEELKACFRPLRTVPVPTIAAIEGPCLGGGLELALHCDVRIAATDALFSLPELRLGFVADVGGTTLLSRLIGPGRASWMLASGRQISGPQALEWGLVEQLCPAGAARETALAFARDVVAGAPGAARATLELLRGSTGDLEHALARETQAGVEALLGGEVMEAMVARMEGRSPLWME